MIVSRQNENVKNFKKLSSKRDYFVLDTEKIIAEALNCDYQPVLCFYADETSAANLNCEKFEVSKEILSHVSNVQSPSTLAVIFKAKKNQPPPKSGRLLVLDGVQDPGNVGTLIRTALGACFDGVVAINSASVCSEKVIRSSMGATFKLPCVEMERDAFVEFAKANDIYLLTASMEGENIFSAKLPKDFALVVGNEGHGPSDEIRKMTNKTISLPMDRRLESLNVAVSGSIIMYELTKGEH